MQGSFFHGLISGLNEGITATRKQNQQDAEKEIQAEQDILMHLAKTHPDQATRDKAVESLLTIHESGKPTGFLGKLLGKKSSNPDIAALIASAHPASGGGGQEAPQPTSPPSVAPPPPDLAAAPTEAPQPAPVFAPAAPVSDAPEDRGAPPTAPVTPLPVDPAGPAATPINTTKQESPISYSAGAQAPAPVSTTPAPFPPPPAASMPPALPVGLGGLSPLEYQEAHAAATVRGQVAAWKAAGMTDADIRERLSGMRQPTSATGMAFSLIEELAPLERSGTITPEQQVQLDAARKVFEKKPGASAAVGSFEDFVTQKYGTRPTPEQITAARKEYNQADDRPPAPRDPVAAELAALRLAEEQAKAEERKRLAASIDKLPEDRRVAIERITNGMQKAKKESWKATLAELVDSGNETELKSAIKQAAVEGETEATKTAVTSREQMVESLNSARAILRDMKRRGVPTGFLTGNAEDIVRKVGTSTNVEYVKLANQLMGTLISYRRAATGVAFSEKESAQYEKMFPNYKNEFPVNDALISGLLAEANTNNKTYWNRKVGEKTAKWLLGDDSSSPSALPPSPKGKPPDTVTYKGVVTKFSDLPPEIQAKVMELRK